MSRWNAVIILCVFFLAVILGPFALFHDRMEVWAESAMATGEAAYAIAAIVILLLALDVVLPIPSTVVSAMAGAALGVVGGVAASAAGMTLGCVLGYVLGRSCGLPLLRRVVSTDDLDYLSVQFRRSAPMALAITRAVPVLAEGSALMAGVSRVNPATYMSVTTMANIGVSLVYCSLGSRSADMPSFLLAFAASLVLPGAFMLIHRISRNRSRINTPVHPPAHKQRQQQKQEP